MFSTRSCPSQLKVQVHWYSCIRKPKVPFSVFTGLRQPRYQIVSCYSLKHVMQAYLLLVPGTITASVCLFFLCRKEANLFLTLGRELELSLMTEFPEESMLCIAEMLFCDWPSSPLSLNFFAFENEYWFNRSPSESSSKSKDNVRITEEACSRTSQLWQK